MIRDEECEALNCDHYNPFYDAEPFYVRDERCCECLQKRYEKRHQKTKKEKKEEMNNSIPNHAEQEREKLKTLLRTAFRGNGTIVEMADYLLDNGVLVSLVPIKKQDYRVETITAMVLDNGEAPKGFVRRLIIDRLAQELKKTVLEKVDISYEEGIYEAKIPVIVPNGKEPF